MSSTRDFQIQISDANVTIRLVEKTSRILRPAKEESISIEQWPLEKAGQISAISRLESAIEANEPGVLLSDDRTQFILSHAFVASLSDAQAQALGLPSTTPFTLSLASTGALLKPETLISTKWLGTAGREVFPKRQGAFLSQGESRYRIPEAFYQVLEAAQKLAVETDLGERMTLLASVVDNLHQSGLHIDADQQITRMKIVHASSMSLDVRNDAASVEFDPVLFGRDVTDEASDEVVVEASRTLLTPVQQDAFANQFRRQSSVNSTYLADGTYVLIDPALKVAANVVKRMQSAPVEDRHRFVRSPQSFIADELRDQGFDDEFVEEMAASALVITDQLSARVKEIGVWTPPVIPFQQRDKNDWQSIVYGIQVAGVNVPIPETKLTGVIENVIQAIEAKTPSIEFDGHQIPADEKTLKALNAIRQQGLNLPPIDIPDPAEEDGVDDQDVLPDEPSVRNAVLVESNFSDEAYIAKSKARTHFDGFEKPAGLLNQPKDHQEVGIGWLQECWAVGYSGALLADDMGLGKTFQTLGFLSWLKSKRKSLSMKAMPVLIVAPTSLLGTWQAEAKLHLADNSLGHMTLLYGTELRSHKVVAGRGNEVTTGQSMLNLEALKSSDWVLTTYETMRDYHLSLSQVPFSCVIFDEMQKVKNISSMMTNAAQALNGDFLLGLTGTPVENSLQDIWTLFDTLMPGALGLGSLKDFASYYTDDELTQDEKDARAAQLSERFLSRIDNRPPPMLRRLKSDVAKDLPQKIEQKVDGAMPQVQADAYHEALMFLREGKNRNQKIKGFQDMRRVSLHPRAPENAGDNLNDYINQSARLQALFAILDKVHAAGEKALVFVESIGMHEWLSVYLKVRYNMDHKPDRIFGAVGASARQGVVERFQSHANKGFDVLLLSPKAAGVGLTLTAATHVIHLTRWWNPAVEDQCTDRAYRIGQENDVNVYYLRALHPVYQEGSFDGVLDALLGAKRALAKNVLTPFSESDTTGAIIDSLINS